MSQPHRIFLASAGTGKTYQLSGRFLDLLLAGAAPDSILATTFTRKAAEEILDRVLKRLVAVIDDTKEREALVRMRDFGEDFEPADAKHLLRDLVRNFQAFEVRTLDSFFIHLGRLFTLELDLPPQWSVGQGPDADEVQEDALARLLEGVHGPEAEAEFAELLREVTSSKGGGRAIHKTLKKLVDDGRDIYLNSDADAWNCIVAPAPVDDTEIDRVIAAFEALDVPLSQANQPLKTWTKAREVLLEALRQRDWKGSFSTTLFGNSLDGTGKFSKRAIPEDWQAVLEALGAVVGSQMLNDLVVRNERIVELLSRYETILRDVKRDRGLYEFSDIARALGPVDGVDPIADRGFDLAYRLDARLHHLLLDEFQDTAPMQWRVLDRLAQEVCADGSGASSFFCVGDIKQSIYGWRAAEPRLLGSLDKHLHVKSETLDRNYRSSRVILETVDRVFTHIASLSVLDVAGKEFAQEAARQFQGRYTQHEAAETLPGVAEIREAAPAVAGRKTWEPVIDLAVERVQALSAECPTATIGVLVRSNKVIPPLIAKLQRLGVRASGEGGNPLTDSVAVLHFLSLLHLADHPSDSVAAFHLSTSPLPTALGYEDPVVDAAALSQAVRERLSQDGLGQLCAMLEPVVRVHETYSAWDRRRFRQLGDLAFSWADRPGLRADRFVDLLRSHKVEDPAPALIKVMTVHSSKGLEFDAVVLPELHGPLSKNSWQFLTCRPEPRDLLQVATVNPGMNATLLDPHLHKLFEQQAIRTVEESLCVLYVAMTRAKHRLEMLVPPPGNNNGGASAAGIVRSALAGEPSQDGLVWRHEDSDKVWMPAPEAVGGAEDAPRLAAVSENPSVDLAATTQLRHLPGRSPSAEEGGRCVSGASLLSPSSNPATRRGQLIHRFFEELEWPGDVELDRDALLAVGTAIEPDQGKREEAFAYLQASMQAAALVTALSKPASGDVTVWREREFCLVMEGEAGPARWKGAFDRVVLFGTEGKYTSAVIQDYKTDGVEPDGLDAIIQHYAPQIHAYRRALSEMTGLPVDRIEAELLFLTPGLVCKVPQPASS